MLIIKITAGATTTYLIILIQFHMSENSLEQPGNSTIPTKSLEVLLNV